MPGDGYRLAERGWKSPAGGAGTVSHAALALLRALADKTGLTGGLSKALASDRLLVHDRRRVLADLACAIADGAEVISDFGVIGDQREMFGLVAPAGWRAVNEIAAGGSHGHRLSLRVLSTSKMRQWPPSHQPSSQQPGITR